MAGDVSYPQVALLLNLSADTVDRSPAPKSVSASGNAQIATVLGEPWCTFDGAGDSLSVPYSTDFNVVQGDFTIEFDIVLSADSGVNGDGVRSACVMCANIPASGTSASVYELSIKGSASVTGTGVDFAMTDAAGARKRVTADFSFAKNTPYQVAIVRQADVGVDVYVGGTKLTKQVDTLALNSAALGTTYPLRIGTTGYTNYLNFLNGAVRRLRITKSARYTAAYTPGASDFLAHAGEVAGVIKDVTGTPCARTVRLVRRDTGALLASTVSDASTGAYRLAAPALDEVQRIVLDDAPGTLYNDLIDRVIRPDAPMAYTRPSAAAADATWLDAAAYTRPAAGSADAAWAPDAPVITIAATVPVVASASLAHGVSVSLAASVPVAAAMALEHTAIDVEISITAAVPVAAGVAAAHGIAGTAVAQVPISAALSAAHGVAMAVAAAVPVAAAMDVLIDRYELRGEVRLSGVLVNRRVRAYLRSSGALVAEGDTVAGKFALHAGFAPAEHYITPIDLADTATDWLPPTANRITSVLASDT